MEMRSFCRMASLQSIPEFSSVDVRIAVQKLFGGGSLLEEVVSSEDDIVDGWI